jgi:catechol 2,3-dioxygenase-like lactoylglutathione lyase family enzyme
VTVEGDIADPDTAQRIVQAAVEHFGRIDTLINNAGIYIGKPFTDYTLEDFNALIAVNVAGFFHMTTRAAKQMLDQGRGHVVNVSTSLVEQPDSSRPAALQTLTVRMQSCSYTRLRSSERKVGHGAGARAATEDRTGARTGAMRGATRDRSGKFQKTEVSMSTIDDELVLAHFIVSDDVERSRCFYTEVLGGRVVFSGEPTYVALSNSWIVINRGGGPTDDKPAVTLETPREPDRVSSFLNIRVKDIEAVHAEWSARGAQFLTPPKQHQYEIRCYVRDPDGHLIEVGQTTDPEGDWAPPQWRSSTAGGES